ncbi:phage tail protein [Micromonospora sp. NPDC005806]|uniref:phage tail protein n=1 Tax=Micromonospora sp. NPDC005806 TaxID=3364234 RepID=UPI003684B328
MAKDRENPYGSFNFLVDFSTGDVNTARGGFAEVSGMNIDNSIMEYRAGNSKTNHAVKINGLYKVGDVTFKRGLIGFLDLYSWMHSLRTGDHSLLRTVHVSLMDEQHNGPVMTWTLINARPMRYTVPSFNAKTGTDVAIEELVLSVEDLTIE